MRPDDDKDARAFNPRAGGIAALIEAEEQGLIKPPIFHAAAKRGPRKGLSLCGETGFTRDSHYAVTCGACKVRMARRSR